MDMQAWTTEHAIHKIWAGSRLYGTARPDSDWDLRDVCLMPLEALLGLMRFDQYQRHSDEEDTCIYGLTRFFALALDANPNILDILCARPPRPHGGGSTRAATCSSARSCGTPSRAMPSAS
jgi:hypothetical protein